MKDSFHESSTGENLAVSAHISELLVKEMLSRPNPEGPQRFHVSQTRNEDSLAFRAKFLLYLKNCVLCKEIKRTQFETQLRRVETK